MRWFGMLLLLLCSSAQAAIEHISLNRLEVDSGPAANLYLNVVGNRSSIEQLQFYLQQGVTKQRLQHQQTSRFLLMIPLERAQTVDSQLLVSTWMDATDDALGQFNLAWAPVVEHQGALISFVNPNSGNAPALKPKQDIEQVLAPAAKNAPAAAQSIPPKNSPKTSTSNAAGGCGLLQGETLWRAGKRLSSEYDIGRYGMMLALFDANPKRFGANPQLMLDSELRCPSEGHLQQWRDEASAQQQFNLMVQQ